MKLCKKEEYTAFQKKLLELDQSSFTNAICLFFDCYNDFEKNNKKISFKFAKYGKCDFIELLTKSKSKKALENNIKKQIGEYQSGVMFELVDLINKLNLPALAKMGDTNGKS